jgi:hypothetical protein
MTPLACQVLAVILMAVIKTRTPPEFPGAGSREPSWGGFGEFAGLFASSAASGLFRSAALWGRARRLVAVTATDIGVGDAHITSLIRAGTRVPLPWCLRSVWSVYVVRAFRTVGLAI